MKTPDKQHMPPELDTLLSDLPAEQVAGLQDAWAVSDQAREPVSQPALDAVWANIEAALDNPSAEAKSTATIHTMRPAARLIPMRWMAAAATILLGAVAIAYLLNPVSVTAPLGEVAVVELRDGSTVELNSGATLHYPRFFTDTRRVSLTGEAFFDVEKDTKPFVIETFNASVRVLGTSFNVRAWENGPDAETRVALATGRVALSAEGESDMIELIPGQTGVVRDASLQASEADTVQVRRALAWRSGNFFYSDAGLGAILDDVARRFDTQVALQPTSLRDRRMKLALEQPASAEAIVKDIVLTLGLAYRQTAAGFEIYSPEQN